MQKIQSNYIKQQYKSGVKNYTELTTEIGLWDSEKYVFEKYLKKSDRILDLGCGTGRTTFPLFRKGYQNIIGVDLTPEMIEKARELNTHFETDLEFNIGDATALEFSDNQFDSVIFSFNGLMSIPETFNRQKALSEINRVLKKESIFIFTTHDRDKEVSFLKFWQEEKKRWNSGHQNPLLHEFGDLIANSKNEEREIFIHIPSQSEVENLLEKTGFVTVETFYRNEKFSESQEVRNKSGDCRFWIVNKIKDL